MLRTLSNAEIRWAGLVTIRPIYKERLRLNVEINSNLPLLDAFLLVSVFITANLHLQLIRFYATNLTFDATKEAGSNVTGRSIDVKVKGHYTAFVDE